MVPEWFWREWTWTKSTWSIRLLEMWKVQTHTMSSYWLKSYGIIYFLPYQIRTHPLQLFCALLAFSHNRQLHHIMWIREALWFKAMGLQDKSLPLPSTALFLIQRFWCRALVNQLSILPVLLSHCYQYPGIWTFLSSPRSLPLTSSLQRPDCNRSDVKMYRALLRTGVLKRRETVTKIRKIVYLQGNLLKLVHRPELLHSAYYSNV